MLTIVYMLKMHYYYFEKL